MQELQTSSSERLVSCPHYSTDGHRQLYLCLLQGVAAITTPVHYCIFARKAQNKTTLMKN